MIHVTQKYSVSKNPNETEQVGKREQYIYTIYFIISLASTIFILEALEGLYFSLFKELLVIKFLILFEPEDTISCANEFEKFNVQWMKH